MGIVKGFIFRLMTQYIQSGEPVLISPHLKLGSIIPLQSHTANHWSNRIEILSANLDLENEEAIEHL